MEGSEFVKTQVIKGDVGENNMAKKENTDALKLRRKAEALIKPMHSGSDIAISEADALSLIHDLEVHQIELELQNQELVLAKEKAELAEEKYTSLYDFAPSGYFTLSQDGQIVGLNLKGAGMLGQERSKLIGASFMMFICPSSRSEFPQFLEQVFTSRIQETCELALLINDEEPKYCVLTGIVSESGEHCLLTAIDITPRVQALKLVESANHQKKLILEAAGEGILGFDKAGCLTFVNPKAEEFLGWKAEELLGKKSHSTFHHHHVDGRLYAEADCPILQTLLLGEAAHGIDLFYQKNGKSFPVEYSSLPIIEDNKLSGAVLTFRDITNREKDAQLINEAKERYDLAMAATRDGLYDWNLITNEVYYSPGWKSMLGYAYDELPNKLSVWESLIDPDDLVKAWRKIDALKNKNLERFEIEFKMKHKDGHWVEVLSRGDVIFDDAGNAVRIVGTHVDITERKTAEQELIRAKEKAEESDRLKSAFLTNLSHEIRTPMNGIIGFADLLKQPGLSGEDQEHYLNIIQRSSDRMLNTITNIVDIAKIESNQMEVQIAEVKVAEKIVSVYSFFEAEAEKKGLKIQLNTSLLPQDLILVSDGEKIYTVLTNLLKNAIKYTNQGSIEIGCAPVGENKFSSVSSYNQAAFLKFHVKDTGIGIAENRQKAIFERFVQADIEDKNAMQGAGLGLSISKAYVEMLGGEIWVESQEGVSSTFYFTIPYFSDAKPKKEPQPNSAQAKPKPHINKLKILIVEDDEHSELLLRVSLQEISRKILTVTSGVDAVSVCRDNPDIDLILMDIRLPGMNGYAATREIRKFNTEVVIFAQTAFGLPGDTIHAKSAGCDAYISKPIKLAHLNSLIFEHCKKKPR